MIDIDRIKEAIGSAIDQLHMVRYMVDCEMPETVRDRLQDVNDTVYLIGSLAGFTDEVAPVMSSAVPSPVLEQP